MANDELVCRGVYTNHVKNTAGDLRNSWLSRKQLARAQVSIWRVGQFETVASLAGKLGSHAKAGEHLLKVVAVRAAQLRESPPLEEACLGDDGSRRACVFDDTQVSATERHQAHAGLASCRKVSDDSATFDKIWEDTFNLFARGEILWSKAA